jgi:hypothetical protein
MSAVIATPTIQPPKKPEPCSLLPHVPPITIPTPFGIDLKSIVDPSKGPPSDCALVHSLMLQLTPMLAGFSCILKILNLVAAIKKALTATPPLIGGISDLTTAIEKMADCIGLVNPLPWLGMIKAILLMVLGYIECLIEGFESIRRLKVGIDLNAEGGTPLLLNTLNCASSNGDTSLDALMSSMGPIQPLLQMLDLIGEIIGMPLGLPSLSAGGASGADPLQPIIDFHDKLQEIVEALPG